MSISPDLPGGLIVVKFGKAIDIADRFVQHELHFNALSGCDVKVTKLLVCGSDELTAAESLARSFFEGHPRAHALDGKHALIDGTERDAPDYAEVRLVPKEILLAAISYFGKLQQEFGKVHEAMRELALKSYASFLHAHPAGTWGDYREYALTAAAAVKGATGTVKEGYKARLMDALVHGIR
ncbi:hypothetical protein HDU86_002746 [Geranomyces michiganensis]|nr:hypothetical protein HDU86_002746 [Geranomyces michiganensis]